VDEGGKKQYNTRKRKKGGTKNKERKKETRHDQPNQPNQTRPNPPSYDQPKSPRNLTHESSATQIVEQDLHPRMPSPLQSNNNLQCQLSHLYPPINNPLYSHDIKIRIRIELHHMKVQTIKTFSKMLKKPSNSILQLQLQISPTQMDS
jgi:hypothetical protein